MSVDLVKGEAELLPKPGRTFDPVLVPKAVKDAGFSAPEVAVTVDGTLLKGEQGPELDVPGLRHPFILADGARAEALRKREDLEGKRVRITGKLHPSGADLPPGLTVEGFQRIP